MKKMITTLKMVKIGNSRGVIFPSFIWKKFELEIGDLVEIEIRKKINGEENSEK